MRASRINVFCMHSRLKISCYARYLIDNCYGFQSGQWAACSWATNFDYGPTYVLWAQRENLRTTFNKLMHEKTDSQHLN